MYIRQIDIQNFQSYYGSDNPLELNKGLNLILGTIGTGKSKLFNAFYWSLYNELYKTSEGWINITNSNYLAAFNKKALLETEVDNELKMRVSLTVVHDKTDYIIERSIKIVKIGDDHYFSYKDWELKQKEFIVRFQDSQTHNTIIYENREAEEFIDKLLFPEKIKKYIWFQGESINELLDINNSLTFEKAIEFLSYIGYYKQNYTLTDSLIIKINRSLNKKRKADTKNLSEFERYETLIKDLEGQIPNLKEEIENIKKEIESNNDNIGKIKNELNDIDEFLDLNKKDEILKLQLEHCLKETEVEDLLRSKNFTSLWMLKGTDEIIEEGNEVLLNFENWVEKQLENEQGLPHDVPGKDYIQMMIDQRKCLICGTKADEGSTPYKKILKKLQSSKDAPILLSPEIRDLEDKVKYLKNYPNRILNKISRIESSINEFLLDSHKNEKEKRNYIEKLSTVREKITQLQARHGQRLGDAKIKRNSYDFYRDQETQLKGKRRIKENSLKDLESKLKQNRSKLDEIPTIKNQKYQEQEILKYLDLLSSAYKTTEALEFIRLIDEIEKRANLMLDEITKANNVINGRISIDRESFEISMVDIDDDFNVDRDINTGHLTILKMCVINAIITTSNEYKNKSYPFITDAPTSDLDDGSTKLYYKEINNEFEQSIIMSKDLFRMVDGKNVVDKEAIKEFEFNNVFLIEKKGSDNTQTEINSYSKIRKL